MDRLDAMRTFVRVVETGSFSAVAREDGTTQSATSKKVAALERALGTKLLSRTTRALALTDGGERYFEQARRLVAEIAEAEQALQAGERQLTGWLRVAASAGYGRLVLMPKIVRFLKDHPAVRIDLRLDDSFIDLVENGIDVAVRIGELADSGLVARRIGTARRAVLASRTYLQSRPASLPRPRVPAELARHDCIVFTGLSAYNEWTFTAQAGADAVPGSRQSVRVSGSLQSNSSEVIRSAVLSGIGIGYVPTWLFQAELASGEVETLLPGWSLEPMPIHAVSPPQRVQAAKVRAFVDHLLALP